MAALVQKLFGLEGKVALITGGNSGIGETIAQALGGAGAKVILVARREADLEISKGKLARFGIDAACLACDLSQREDLARCVAEAPKYFGTPSILVNAAGVNLRNPFDALSEQQWDDTLAINLSAPFLLTQGFAPAMREAGWGRIINIASLQSVRAFANSAPYGASKGGIMQLTRAAAEYWSRYGVTCNAIAPGFFETGLTAPVFADPVRTQANADRTFVGRNGKLPDLHGTAIYLASEASAYVTGQTIFVDGGFSAG